MVTMFMTSIMSFPDNSCFSMNRFLSSQGIFIFVNTLTTSSNVTITQYLLPCMYSRVRLYSILSLMCSIRSKPIQWALKKRW